MNCRPHWLLLMGLVACGRYGFDPSAGDGDPGSANDAGAGSDGGILVGAAPHPVITVTPVAGTLATEFVADATGSRDDEDPPEALVYEWDFEGEQGFATSGLTAAHTYASVGTKTVVLRVTDTDGNVAFASQTVFVSDSTDLIIVTTGVDESDGAATPDAPGGAGLSLREAMIYANGQPGAQTIYVPRDITTVLQGSLPNLTDADGVTIIGDGAVIDGSNLGGSGNCFSLGTSGARIGGLEITGCPGRAINLFGGTDNQIFDCYLHGNGYAVLLNDGGNRFGPGNRVVAGRIQVAGDNEVIGNVIRGATDIAILVTGTSADTLVAQNVVYSSDVGIQVNTNVNNVRMWHNTIYGSSVRGVLIGSNNTGIEIRNSVLVNNATGVLGSDTSLSAFDHCDLFGNGTDCSGCTSAGNLSVEPGFVAPASGDFRLNTGSPLIDQGADLGLDINGPSPGLFNGQAPDIGAIEAAPR